MILDATAGNRTMWLQKRPDSVIFIDIEKKLDVRPNIFASNEQTPFKDKTFDAIFYDPPHNWGGAIHYFSFPSAAERAKVFKNATGVPTYYGWDKFRSRQALVSHMYRAQKEFRRLLKDDGVLWFKWNEMRININSILAVFHDWNELMRLYINDPTHTAGEQQTFWVMMNKKEIPGDQTSLLQF